MFINIINLKVKLADLILLSEYLGLEPNTVFAAEEAVIDHPYTIGMFIL